jgi:hypothetical protein
VTTEEFGVSVVVQVRDGRVRYSCARSTGSTILVAEPAACNPGMSEWRVVVASGPLHESTNRRVVCRARGRYYDLEVVSQQRQPDGSVCYKLECVFVSLPLVKSRFLLT